MIDLHTHLLPEFDDGARSLEEALALCRLAADDGTTIAVVTPHSGARAGLPPQARPTAADVAAHTAALQAALDQAEIPLRLVTGMEVYVEADLLTRPLITLGNSRAVLLELPATSVPPGLDEFLFRLQAAGYVPVLAHPERNTVLADDPAQLYDFVTRGCLAQLTAASLTGASGGGVQRVARQLIEHDLVQVIASDAHWFPDRPTGLSAAVVAAAKLIGDERAQALVTSVPQSILNGRAVTGFSPTVPPRTRPFWHIW